MGRFPEEVSLEGDILKTQSQSVKLIAERNPEELPWGEMGVDVVIESTGIFRQKSQLENHLKAGAKRVVLTVPAKDEIDYTVVLGVNDDGLKPEHKIVSNASCTTNCLAPMAKVLEDKFGIVTGLMLTVHAYTNDQNTLDGPHPKGDLRRARAAAANIVPNSTGAAKAIGLVLPSLKGKLDGSAQRVPTITGSLTELTTILSKKVTVAEVNEAMKAAANESFGYTEDEIVSSDIIGITYGSLFDATQTKVMTQGDVQMVKTVSWYDNEMSYVSQLVRTVKYFASKIK